MGAPRVSKQPLALFLDAPTEVLIARKAGTPASVTQRRAEYLDLARVLPAFQIVDVMITNFHPPKSSLMIMVAAFGGYDLIMKAYKEAIKEKYRFYSYGDAMLII